MTFSKLGTDTETGQLVFLPKASRLQGLYIIGIQGTGKSGLIENLIMQDIDQQIGVCVIDPHGELIDHVIARLPNTAVDKVILLDINDYQHPFGLNLFTCADLNNPTEVQKTVDQIMHVFEKLLGVSHDTPLILQYLRNCTYTLIANPGYTMAEIPLLLTDKNCRQQLVANVKRLQTRLFWQQYEQMKPSEQIEQMASIQRRVDDFLQDLILPIVGQSTTTIDLQKIMHEGRILLVKLSAQVDSVSSLIGSLMIALLLNAAYNRPAQRRQFHLYADEFQRFATEDFATLLEEARKFAIGTTIAHQNRGQLNSANSKLETDLKDRSRSVGNLVVFKVNSKDAEDLAGEFDCSPPPAKQEEVGRRKKQTPVTDVVGWLLSNRGGHKDAIVNTFANTTLRLLTDTLQEDIRQINANNASSNYRASGQSEATLLSYRNMLNKLLYEAMIHVSPLSTIPLDAMSYFLEVLGCSLYTWKIRGNTTISEQEIIAREITYQQNVTRLQTVTQQLLKAEEQAIKLRARFAIACEGRVRLMTHREFQRWYDDFYTKIRNRSELEHFVYDNLDVCSYSSRETFINYLKHSVFTPDSDLIHPREQVFGLGNRYHVRLRQPHQLEYRFPSATWESMWEWGVNPTKQPHNQWEDERTIRSAAAQEFLPELQSFLAPIKAQLIFRIVPENLVYRPLDVTWEGRRGFDFYAWRYRLPKVAIDQIENLLLSIKTAYDNHEAYRSALEQEKHTLETAIQEYKRHNPYPDTELAARKAERAINAFLNASPSQEQQYLDVLIDLIEKPIQKAPIAYAKTAFEAWLTLKEQFKSYLLGAISAWHLDYPFMAMNFPYDAAVSNPQNPLILLGVRNPANGRLYSDQELEAQLNKLLVEQHTCFMNFIRELKSVLGALAANPILADSGEEEVIYRPGPVRPYQDIKNDIANQLSGLPSFTARVKISGNSPQNPGKKCLNCGRQSNSATAKFCQGCGTRLPAPNEYTITTLKPAVGIGTQQLQQRIARIQARNVQDGYLSERVKVEAEILQRQQSCSSSPPAHPQLPPQQPRHARQVPVQGSCPNCGKSNPPGSKFCNQCGTKL